MSERGQGWITFDGINDPDVIQHGDGSQVGTISIQKDDEAVAEGLCRFDCWQSLGDVLANPSTRGASCAGPFERMALAEWCEHLS